MNTNDECLHTSESRDYSSDGNKKECKQMQPHIAKEPTPSELGKGVFEY